MKVINHTKTAGSWRGARRYVKQPATLLLLFGILLTHGGTTMALQQGPDLPLEKAAASALSGDPSAIRVLTDTVISQLPVTFHPSLNVNDRLFQAELQYRQHARLGTGIGQLVSALNHLADDLKLPRYVKTNANQVQTYRMMMFRVYPSLSGAAPNAVNAPSDLSLSPSAATFVILNLLQLKLIEPSYQTDPDTWVRDTEAKRKQAASRPPSRTIRFTAHFDSSPVVASPHYKAIATGLATNSGPAVGPVLLMLGTLGL